MKKILLTLCALIAAASGAWGQTTVTICDNAKYCSNYGTWSNENSNSTTFTTNDASGLAGVTITSEDIDGTTAYVMNQGYYSSSYKYTYQIKATKHYSYKITLTAPEGYIITGYNLTTMKTSTNKNSTNCKVTAADGTGTAYFNTAGTNLSVSGLSGNSTYFTVESYTTDSSVELNIFYFTITVAEASSSTVDVTYKVVYDDEVVNTSAATTQNVGDAPSLPLYNKRAYCTYTYYSDEACNSELTTLTSSSTPVYAKCTYSGPFNFASSAEDATTNGYWTAFKLADSNNYVYCNNSSLAYTTTIAVDNKYQWAIIGNPYGYRLYNRGAGDDNEGAGYLNSSSVPSTNGGSTSSFNFDNTGITFELFRMSGRTSNDEFVSVIKGTNTNSHSGTVINYAASNLYIWCGLNNTGFYCYGNYMSGLSTSFLRPADVPSYSSLVDTYITPWYDAAGDGYFTISEDTKTALDEAGYTAATTSCNETTYNSLLAIVTENIKFPATGFYRIKTTQGFSDRGGTVVNYIGLYTNSEGTSTLQGVQTGSQTADLGTIVYLTKGESSTYTTTYTMQLQGLNVQACNAANTAVTATSDANTVTFGISTPGQCYIQVGSSTTYSLHLANTNNAGSNANVVAYNHDSGASQWIVEAAEDATVSLNAVGDNTYATLCAPFQVSSIDGASAYTISSLSTTEAEVSAASTPIAAGTPVLLQGTAASATLTIGSNYVTAPVSSTLTGTFVDLTVTEGTDYFLGTDGSKVGFFKWYGTTLKANRAYLKNETVNPVSGGVKGFVLNFDNLETGINGMSEENGNKVFYDLSGRRVNTPTRGLYIVNGKKVAIK